MIDIIKNITRRILGTLLILLIVSFISFALMNLSSSDPAEIFLSSQGTVVTDKLLQSVRHEMGLDKPFLVQYFNWLSKIVKGDFGTSYATGRSVLSELLEHLPYTIALATSAMFITLIISIPLGIIWAINKNKYINHIIRTLTFVGNSIP